MQLDSASFGVLSNYIQPLEQVQDIQQPRARRVTIAQPMRARRLSWDNWQHVGNVFGLSFSAATATVIVCQFVAPVGMLEPEFLVDESFVVRRGPEKRAAITPTSKPKQDVSPILEMRPANRSLAEKAREELSEFERDYPW